LKIFWKKKGCLSEKIDQIAKNGPVFKFLEKKGCLSEKIAPFAKMARFLNFWGEGVFE
jgi:hypothetical protein